MSNEKKPELDLPALHSRYALAMFFSHTSSGSSMGNNEAPSKEDEQLIGEWLCINTDEDEVPKA